MKLLPHFCNRVAWGWLLLYFIIAFLTKWSFPEAFRLWIGIINILALIIACFSSEKVEDEGIQALRLNSVAWSSIILFMLQGIVFILSFCSIIKETLLGNTIIQFSKDFFFWVLVYLMIFKCRVLIIGWRSRYEK